MNAKVRKHKPPRFAQCAYCNAVNKPPGTRSTIIDFLDKQGLFCTLRCAAAYGIRAAESRML